MKGNDGVEIAREQHMEKYRLGEYLQRIIEVLESTPAGSSRSI